MSGDVVEKVAVLSNLVSLALSEIKHHDNVMFQLLDVIEDGEDEWKRKRKVALRRVWVRPYQTGVIWHSFERNLVFQEEWNENLRMSREAFSTYGCSLFSHI